MSVQNSHHFKNWQKLRLNYHIHFALHYQAINWGGGGEVWQPLLQNQKETINMSLFFIKYTILTI